MGRERIAVSSGERAMSRTTMQWAPEVRHWLHVFALLCLISLLAFVYLTQASQVARQIEQMEVMERDLQILKRQNNSLRIEIADYQQLTRIKEQAQRMGLGPAEHMEYLEVVTDASASQSLEAAPLQAGQSSVGSSMAPITTDATQPLSWRQKLTSQFAAWVNAGAPSGDGQ